MRYVRMSSVILFLMTAFSACQTADPSTPVPVEPVLQTEAPGSLPESNTTQAFTPTLPQEDVEMVPPTLPDEAAEKMVTLVKQHLAQKLSITVDQIVLSDIKPVVWRDAGLGCPKPGVDYIQMETPGYNITLGAGGQTYTYHTDETKRFVQCNK